MQHRDYLFEMNPYSLSEGVTEMQENYELEKRVFNEFIFAIGSGHELTAIELKLEALLSVISCNYFCRGLKMGMQLALSLDDSDFPEAEE